MGDRLSVFVSSIMSAEDLSAERSAAVAAIQSLTLTVPWAFEFAPAEPIPATQAYLQAVFDCDLVVLIVSRTHSSAVQSELDAAESSQKPVLAFVRRADPRSGSFDGRNGVLKWLRERVKYREFGDLRELEAAVRESLTTELVRGYRKFRLHQQDLVAIFKQVPAAPTLAVERASVADIRTVQNVLLTELLEWYPDISAWASKVAREAQSNPSEVRVAKVGGEIGGLSVTREKDSGVRKFSTFYVRPGHRGEAIGPRLVYEEVLRAARDGVRKAFVTFADELSQSLAPLLERYGFVTEGISGARYRPGAGEWVMSKTFAYGNVDAAAFTEFVLNAVVRAHGGRVVAAGHNQFEVVLPATSLFGYTIPRPTRLAISVSPEPETDYQDLEAEMKGHDWMFFSLYGKPADATHWSHRRRNWVDAEDLRSRFYPVEFVTPEEKSVLCTIQPAYADALIPQVRTPRLFGPERLQIRPDNVYYRSPNQHKHLRRGARVLFYVSSPNKHLRGSARLRELRVATPAELVEMYGTMGILDYEDIQGIAQRHQNQALALVFDWYVEHRQALGLSEIAKVISSFNPISARLLSYGEAARLVAAGDRGA